ncbi:MAG: class I SAM-dependent methyltransferase [Pirellulales bacterium]
MLDVGCGEGHSTRFFRELGCEVLGVDGSPEALRNTVVPGSVELHDFCQGAFPARRRFDLVWTCEFLEHVEEEFLPHVVATLGLADKFILATHAFPKQKGHHHVNCQPSRYWISVLEQAGYGCSLSATLAARRATFADHRRVNHFVRSGLVLEKLPADVPPSALSFEELRRAGQHPSFSARAKGALLYRHFRAVKRWKGVFPTGPKSEAA